MSWVLYITLMQKSLHTFEISLQSKGQCERALKKVKEQYRNEFITGTCRRIK